jgi:hypothetical protein
LALGLGNTARVSIDRAGAEWGLLQRETFGEASQLVRYTASFALVRPCDAAQPREPKAPVSADPALRGAQRQPCLRSDACERDSLFQMWAELAVSIKGARRRRDSESPAKGRGARGALDAYAK